MENNNFLELIYFDKDAKVIGEGLISKNVPLQLAIDYEEYSSGKEVYRIIVIVKEKEK